MASVSAIRSALKTTILNGLGNSVSVYDNVPSVANLPAVIVEPAKADFEMAMGRGADEWTFNVFVMVSRRDDQLAQSDLDAYISGAGTSSIRQLIFQNPSLGLTDGSTACVRGMRGYAGTFKESGMSMVGAILSVCVYTNGAV